MTAISERNIVQNLEERIGNVRGPMFRGSTHMHSLNTGLFTQVASKDYPGVYPGEDHTWNVTKFRDGLKLEVQRLTPSSVEFDLIGVDASVANSLRRTLIAEVPTIAIESVYVYNNTSIMQDEVLASRLGLIPLKVDPRKMNWKPQASGGDGWTGLEESKYIVSETMDFETSHAQSTLHWTLGNFHSGRYCDRSQHARVCPRRGMHPKPNSVPRRNGSFKTLHQLVRLLWSHQVPASR